MKGFGLRTGCDEFAPRRLSLSNSQTPVAYVRRGINDRRGCVLVPPSLCHWSTTMPWRFMMDPTIRSFGRSGAVIATEEA